jgi:hypothetical protein
MEKYKDVKHRWSELVKKVNATNRDAKTTAHNKHNYKPSLPNARVQIIPTRRTTTVNNAAIDKCNSKSHDGAIYIHQANLPSTSRATRATWS